jgi:cytoskeletal protein RodZ
MPDTLPKLPDSSVSTGAAAVGQMLREARESLGFDLARVAKDIRIRQHFLEAIEAGRFDDLPGGIYPVAFLRGYAAHVRLDVDRVLQVYRSGDAVVAAAPTHHFPVIARERRMPRAAMVLASAFLLVCAYVTWHALTRGHLTQDVRVPPVPDRLLADQKAPPAASGQVASTPPPPAPPAPSSPSSSSTVATAPPTPAPPASVASAPVAPASPPPPPTVATPPTPATAPQPATAAVPPTSATPPTTAPSPQPTAAAPSPPPVTPVPLPVLPGTQPAVPPPATVTAPPGAAGAPTPAVADRTTAAPRPAPARPDPRQTPDVTRGTGADVKPEPVEPQVATAPPAAPASAPSQSAEPARSEAAPARRSAWTWGSGDDVTARDGDPTQGNRITARSESPRTTPAGGQPPAQAPRPPEVSSPTTDQPPQQATRPPDAASPVAPRARIVAGPPAPQARTVRAVVDSTLELRTATGEVLATTHLRAGTTYTVPEHVGYVLTPVAR